MNLRNGCVIGMKQRKVGSCRLSVVVLSVVGCSVVGCSVVGCPIKTLKELIRFFINLKTQKWDQIIFSKKHGAIGPYSQAGFSRNTLYVSGNIATRS